MRLDGKPREVSGIYLARLSSQILGACTRLTGVKELKQTVARVESLGSQISRVVRIPRQSAPASTRLWAFTAPFERK